jgi:hypothetical protein
MPPMNVATFSPTYPSHQRTRSTALSSGKIFNYKKLRIREDLVDALEEIRPSTKTLTAYINSVLESYLAGYR